MKKLVVLTFTIILLIILSSCKTHERCPAYGKTGKAKFESSSYALSNYRFDYKKNNPNKSTLNIKDSKDNQSPIVFN